MRRFILLCVVLPCVNAFAQSGGDAVVRYENLFHPVLDASGMVAAQNAVAARAGAQVLADGGNAVDAAVAVGFALAVTLPRAGNIGGGGFMLVYDAESEATIAIDYREMAPIGATRDMFLDASGNPDPKLSRASHLASGVPGTVAGFHLAHQKFGRLPWKSLLEPAIKLARDGILVSYDLASNLKRRQSLLCSNKASCGYFYKEGGGPIHRHLEVLSEVSPSRPRPLLPSDGPQ